MKLAAREEIRNPLGIAGDEQVTTVLYWDAECTRECCVNPWASRPEWGCPKTMVNCNEVELEWVGEPILSPMVASYIEAMLWADCTDDNLPEGMDARGTEHVDHMTLAQIRQDCRDFARDNYDTLRRGEQAYKDKAPGPHDWCEQVGHDLYLTRNGHGAGFWDREYLSEDVASELAQAAERMGPMTPTVDPDSGKVFTIEG